MQRLWADICRWINVPRNAVPWHFTDKFRKVDSSVLEADAFPGVNKIERMSTSWKRTCGQLYGVWKYKNHVLPFAKGVSGFPLWSSDETSQKLGDISLNDLFSDRTHTHTHTDMHIYISCLLDAGFSSIQLLRINSLKRLEAKFHEIIALFWPNHTIRWWNFRLFRWRHRRTRRNFASRSC